MRFSKNWIYAIQMMIPREAERPIKIGIAEHVVARLGGLKTGSPYPLTLLGYWPAPKGTDTEHELHKKWDQWRLEGEWFYPAPELLQEIKLRSESFQSLVTKRWPTEKQAAFARKNKNLSTLMWEVQALAYEDWIKGYDLIAQEATPRFICDSCQQGAISLTRVIRKAERDKLRKDIKHRLEVYIDGNRRRAHYLLPVDEIEKVLGVSKEYLRRAVQLKIIPHFRLGKQYRGVKFRSAELCAWLDSDLFDDFIASHHY